MNDDIDIPRWLWSLLLAVCVGVAAYGIWNLA